MGALERREIVLRVEREVPGPDGAPRRVSLSARYDLAGRPEPPTAEELGEATRELDRELGSAIAQAGFPSVPVRPDRDLVELIETYRPRQAELVDALESDGELSRNEAQLLRTHLASNPPSAPPATRDAPPPPLEVPVTDRPLAALPLSNDRAPSNPRPVSELLGLYRIESLKQAGAVRARRQISYEEYMALKRHFSPEETNADRSAAARSPSP
ncbi:MAG TPA: hypothetical protein VN842_02850 [Thermoplasmata archaeon]|nr:hypothetical protein [Thermoplasmata archaeon]